MKKAIVLLSGGLDSTTVLAYAINQGFDCYPITFDYDQRHVVELKAARRIAEKFNSKNHHIVKLSHDVFGKSALTDKAIEVPDYIGSKEIPVTYVPARNTIFLSIALAYAENLHAKDIFAGMSAVDYSGYPDCRPEYLAAFEAMANLATKEGVEGARYQIHAPLVHLSKKETIELGRKLGVDYSLTISCYRADPETGAACGSCDSCFYRKKGFAEAGIADPTLYC